MSPALPGLFLLFLITAGCPSQYQKYASKTVVQVNNHQLSAKEFSNQLARKLRGFDALGAKDPANVYKAKEDVVNDYVIKSLTLDWATANGILVSDHDVDREVEKFRAQYPDDITFRKSLANEGLSFSEWRDDVRFRLIQKLFFAKLNEKNPMPTDESIQHYYQTNKEEFRRKERILIRQIVLANDASAEVIRGELKKTDFAKLAQKHSITPEGKKGGLVGWIEKGSVDYFDSLFHQPLNSVQEIKSPFGNHLVRVEQKAPAGPLPLDSVKNLIIAKLKAQKEQGLYVSWLDANLRSSKVYKNYDLINSLVVSTKEKENTSLK